MEFLGRQRELGTLRTQYDSPRPVRIRVTGPPGVGKTALLARSLQGLPHLHLTCPPLPDPDIRSELHRLIRGTGPEGGDGEVEGTRPGLPDPVPTWRGLIRTLRRRVARQDRAWVLVLDDAHRLTEARSAVEEALGDGDAPGPPLHLVLAGRRPGLPKVGPVEAAKPDAEDPMPPLELALGPLPFRAVQHRLPGREPEERLRAYGIFGGWPAHIAAADARMTPITALRRTLLDPDAPLAHRGLALLERALQTPARYAALLKVLSRGEAGWGDLHAGVRDLTSSGQVAPYVARLEAMGWVEVRRSLDADPRSRSRRYRILDPFLAFWFRFVLPRLARLGQVDGEALLEEILPELDDHMDHVFPAVGRQFMEHDVMEFLAANARACGSLWGDGYEMPVAGILANGVPFYGSTHWSESPRTAFLRRLDEGIRETRYGFGRELRLRVLVARAPFPRELERAAASRQDTLLVGPRELAGEA